MKATSQGLGRPRIAFFASLQGAHAYSRLEYSTLKIRISHGRNEVLDMERDATAAPLLTMKAVNTAECELIAEPVPETVVILITRGTVTSDVRRDWVLKSDHEPALLFFGKPENSLFSSSSSTSVGRRDTWSIW